MVIFQSNNYSLKILIKMATTVGTLVRLKLGGVFVFGETSSSHTASATEIDVSSKASGNETNVEYGRVKETASFSSLASTDSTSTEFGFKAARDAMYAKTKVEYVETEYDEAGVEVVGAYKYTGNVVITNAAKDNPDNDKLTFTCDVSFDGKPVETINA